MPKKSSQLWNVLEDMSIDPGNILEVFQSVREESFKDLKKSDHIDSIDYFTDIIRDVSVIIIDLEAKILESAKQVLIY